jgi:hypothetical protein
VDEVRHGLDHAKLDVVVDAAHQPEVQDAQASVGRADQVAGVRVGLGWAADTDALYSPGLKGWQLVLTA